MNQTRRNFIRGSVSLVVAAAVPGGLIAASQSELDEHLMPQPADYNLNQFTVETLRRMSEAMGVPYDQLAADYRDFTFHRIPEKRTEISESASENKKGTPQHP